MSYPKDSGIYKIQNKLNGKSYIGQSQNLDVRIRTHLCLLRNNKHYNCHLQSAWNKYGSSAFDISILTLCDIADLDKLEIRYIQEYDAFTSGYNRTLGGDGTRGALMSEEARAKMRISHQDYTRGNHPQARPIVLLNNGERFDCIEDAADEYGVAKADISGCAKREHHSAGACNGERLVWAYESDFVSMTDDEIMDLIVMAQTCKRGKNSPHSKPVICVSTGEVFNYIGEAAEHYGVSPSVIGAACSGKQKCAAKDENGNKLRWMFYDAYLEGCANGDKPNRQDIQYNGAIV